MEVEVYSHRLAADQLESNDRGSEDERVHGVSLHNGEASLTQIAFLLCSDLQFAVRPLACSFLTAHDFSLPLNGHGLDVDRFERCRCVRVRTVRVSAEWHCGDEVECLDA